MPDLLVGSVSLAGEAASSNRAQKSRSLAFSLAAEKAASRLADQPGEYSQVTDADKQASIAYLTSAIDRADRSNLLGSALLAEGHFRVELLGQVDARVDGLSQEGQFYLDALIATTHGVVRSLSIDSDVVGASVVAMMQTVAPLVDASTTRAEVEDLITQALQTIEDERPVALRVAGRRPRVISTPVARDELLALEKAFVADDRATICSLGGMRGIGKTQLAALFAERCENASWAFVGWVTASSRTQAIADLAAMAWSAKLLRSDASAEEAAQMLLTHLSNLSGDRLLVFDNVEAFEDLNELLPSGAGIRVLVTTTVVDSNFGIKIAVQLFDEKQSVAHLENGTGLRDDGRAAPIATKLGYLPLALTQAATTIRLRDYTYGEYLEALNSSQALDSLFLSEGGDPYPLHVTRALRLAEQSVLDCMPTDAIRSAARRILEALALHGGGSVPRKWLYALGEQETARDAVGILVRESILTQTVDRTVSLHRLFARLVRDDARLGEYEDESLDSALNVFGTAISIAVQQLRDAQHQRARVALRELGQSLTDLTPQNELRTLWNSPAVLGIVLEVQRLQNQISDPGPAMALSRYLDIAEGHLGKTHKLVMNIRDALAVSYLHGGFTTKALALHEVNHSEWRKLESSSDPDAIHGLNNYALALERDTQFSQSISIYLEILPIAERIHGTNGEVVLNILNNLGGAYERSGNAGQAISIHQRVLKGRAALLGDQHKDTLTSQNNLANAYFSSGSVDVAIDLYRSTLGTREKVYGLDHAHTITSRNSLVGAYIRLDRGAEIVTLCEEAYEIAQMALGSSHPATITAIGSLAAAYRSSGNFWKALKLLKRQLEYCVSTFGPANQMTFVSRNNLGEIFLSAGNAVKAVQLFEQNLAIAQSSSELSADVERAAKNLALARTQL
ncbi:tetratricopeptide repeat protein [Rathayibacter sp. Leaf296]|uniref:tetratricopeptide repeat protein n=1 Tax=Rathayibacter sp. Leaf296 TaxID=1736327 RepID=UPI00138F7494|nr:tetratricopeptide repeat protein [Rathayibacter sp. Leaf296]